MTQSLPEPKHRTLQARESHHLGSDGLPAMHTSELSIEARSRMTSYPYYFDTDAARLDVVHGGTAGEPYDIAGVRAVDVVFEEPLEEGGQQTLVFETHFNYRTPPPPEFRRAVGRLGMGALELQVTFDTRLPGRLWTAQWEGYGPDALIVPGTEVVAQLSPIHGEPSPMEAWYRQTDVQPGVYGFRWEW